MQNSPDPILRDESYWFHKYDKGNFTQYFLAHANLNWAYWAAYHCTQLAEESQPNHNSETISAIKEKIKFRLARAQQIVDWWPDAPPPLRLLLEHEHKHTVLFTKHRLHFAESLLFHKTLGINKEEDDSITRLLTQSEQNLISVSSQFMDERYMERRCSRAIYILHDLLKLFLKPNFSEKDISQIIPAMKQAKVFVDVDRAEVIECCMALTKHLCLPEESYSSFAYKSASNWLRCFSVTKKMINITEDWTELFLAYAGSGDENLKLHMIKKAERLDFVAKQETRYYRRNAEILLAHDL